MKSTTIICLLLILLNSCSNPPSTKANLDSDHPTKIDPREKLITALKSVHEKISSEDKIKIASLFPFPIADSMFTIYVGDTTYTGEFERNGKVINEEMFMKYFHEITTESHLSEVNRIFEFVNVDSLLKQDSLFHEVRIPNEPCAQFHAIVINKNRVNLQFGSNPNQDYLTSSEANEVEQDLEEGCKYMESWYFEFDGEAFHFTKRLAVAG